MRLSTSPPLAREREARGLVWHDLFRVFHRESSNYSWLQCTDMQFLLQRRQLPTGNSLLRYGTSSSVSYPFSCFQQLISDQRLCFQEQVRHLENKRCKRCLNAWRKKQTCQCRRKIESWFRKENRQNNCHAVKRSWHSSKPLSLPRHWQIVWCKWQHDLIWIPHRPRNWNRDGKRNRVTVHVWWCPNTSS